MGSSVKPLSHYRRSASEPEVAPVSEPVLVPAVPSVLAAGRAEDKVVTPALVVPDVPSVAPAVPAAVMGAP